MTKEEALRILDTIPTIGDQVDALEMAIEALEQKVDTLTETDDISRQGAIDAIYNANFQIYDGDWAIGRRNYMTKEEACAIIDGLPSAQHDIVEVLRCKDCKYHDGLDGQCPVQSTGDPFYDYKPDDNWFCADGERRE